MNCDADIKTIMSPAMILTLMASLPKKVSESMAPKISACEKESARFASKRPTPALFRWASFSTKKRPIKIGICSKSGRQELKGLEPVRL